MRKRKQHAPAVYVVDQNVELLRLLRAARLEVVSHPAHANVHAFHAYANPPAMDVGGRPGASVAYLAPLPEGAYQGLILNEVQATAYAYDLDTLVEALCFAANDDHDARFEGPLRLTYTGTIDLANREGMPPIGTSFELGDEPMFLGTHKDAEVSLPCPALFDRNTRLEKDLAGVRVIDVARLNATHSGEERFVHTVLAPGRTFSIAGMLHFRIDGELPTTAARVGGHLRLVRSERN